MIKKWTGSSSNGRDSATLPLLLLRLFGLVFCCTAYYLNDEFQLCCCKIMLVYLTCYEIPKKGLPDMGIQHFGDYCKKKCSIIHMYWMMNPVLLTRSESEKYPIFFTRMEIQSFVTKHYCLIFFSLHGDLQEIDLVQHSMMACSSVFDLFALIDWFRNFCLSSRSEVAVLISEPRFTS